MTVHSKIGASSMYRWSKCPGSVKLSEGIESVSSSYADEGTRAHAIAALVVEGKPIVEDCDDEMWESVCLYRDTIWQDRTKLRSNNDKNIVEFNEHGFDLSESVYPGCFGTCDYAMYSPKAKGLYVYDFKYGAGIPVEVENNSQLRYYGLGALISTDSACDWVELVVIQPRCNHPDGPVRRQRLSTMDLLDFTADLIEFAKATESPDAPLVPGDHCRFCPAAANCPALHSKAQLVAREEFSPTKTYDPGKLSEVLHWLPALENWAKSVREFAYAEAMHGRTPPGWKLAAKRATRKWRDHVDFTVINQTFGLLEYDVFEEPKMKSPAQVEKLIGKTNKEQLEALVSKESSGVALVPDSDKREAIRNDPKSEFTTIDVQSSSVH